MMRTFPKPAGTREASWTAAVLCRFLVLLLSAVHSASAATHTVSMVNTRFVPSNLSINVGDTVTWRCDSGFHDTVSGANGVPNGVWNSSSQFPPIMRPGNMFSFTFNAPGSFPYYCTPHWMPPLNMVGTITVQSANAPPSVFIISPPDGSNLTAPADVVLEAVASDADGDAVSVEFFVNGSSLGVLPAPPHRVVVTNLGPGHYTFSATARDTAGASATASGSIIVSEVVCDFTLSKLTASFPPERGTDTVTVTGPPTCQWTVGNTNLWIQTTVALSTVTITVLSNVTHSARSGFLLIAGNTFTVSQAATPFPAKNDFNRDGQTDFLWQNTDGRVNVWLMDGPTRIGVARLRNGRPAPLGARIVGTHDFDLDRNVDILWQRADGSLQIWFMSATNFLRAEVISPAPALGIGWQVVGVGDFNRDMHADILLRHTEGYLLLWYMRGKQYLRQTLLYNGQVIPPLWRVAGVADFNNDGQTDIIWQKPGSAIVVWFMNGENPLQGPLLAHLPKINAAIVGMNDLNQDDSVDFIWRHPDGHLSTWWMKGTNRIGFFPIQGGEPVAAAWKFTAPRN